MSGTWKQNKMKSEATSCKQPKEGISEKLFTN